jgi:hypothetical protein
MSGEIEIEIERERERKREREKERKRIPGHFVKRTANGIDETGHNRFQFFYVLFDLFLSLLHF